MYFGVQRADLRIAVLPSSGLHVQRGFPRQRQASIQLKTQSETFAYLNHDLHSAIIMANSLGCRAYAQKSTHTVCNCDICYVVLLL